MTDYASLAEFKAEIPLSSVDATRDAVITRMLTAASRAIDAFCGRPDGFVSGLAAARYFAGSGNALMPIDECTSITEVAVKDSAIETTYTAWAATDWIPFTGDPERPNFNKTPYTWLMVDPSGSYVSFTSGNFLSRGGFSPLSDGMRATKTVKVTATWGYAATVPDQIKEACLIQTARWWKRAQSSWGDSMASPELGVLIYRQKLDPDVANILVGGRFVKMALG